MKVILFGATGMVGQGVLRECLLDPAVSQVLAIGRVATGQKHDKLREIAHANFLDFAAIESETSGYDACFYCVGITSSGMKEEDYHRVTYEYAVSAARTLLKVSPGLTFIFVSGAGSDSTERGKTMWARVKGKTENAILAMPFKASFVFRPAIIRPLHGIKSKTRSYRVMYSILGPLVPLIKAISPGSMSTTEIVGRAMLKVAKQGAPVRVLHTKEINAMGEMGG